MSDPPKETNGGDGGQLSMEKRLLLAFLLMGAVLFLTPYFYQPQPPAEQARPETQTEEVAPVVETSKPPPPVETAAGESPERKMPPPIAATAEETYTIETDVYKIVFSNRGAVVKSWILKNYVDGKGNPLELVHQAALDKAGYPFSIEFSEGAGAPEVNTGLYQARKTDEPPAIDFELSDGHIYVRKSFRFEPGRYVLEFSSEVLQDGKPVPHLLAWRGGFGDVTVFKAASTQHSLFYDLTNGKLVVNDAGDADDGPLTNRGNYSFAGIEDSYFAAVALPAEGSTFEVRTFRDMVKGELDEQEEPYVGTAIGGAGQNSFPLFVGPKDLDLLKEIDPKLQEIVDFGWFSLLAKPLFLALKWLNNRMVHNYGWSIVVLTIAINILLFPLKISSLKSMKKMQALQPQVKALNEKYKGIGLRDPRKSKQNEELMALYKKHGVNPMGGCMPMVLQIPFFFAFYKVLRVAIELRGAEWLWVTDLSQPEHLAIRILPIAMVISQFAAQKMTPTTTPHASQQRVMYMMPLFMGFIFYGVSSGLVLYWLTSNLVGVAQQLIINKIGDSSGIPAEPEPKAKPKKRRPRKR